MNDENVFVKREYTELMEDDPNEPNFIIDDVDKMPCKNCSNLEGRTRIMKKELIATAKERDQLKIDCENCLTETRKLKEAMAKERDQWKVDCENRQIEIKELKEARGKERDQWKTDWRNRLIEIEKFKVAAAEQRHQLKVDCDNRLAEMQKSNEATAMEREKWKVDCENHQIEIEKLKEANRILEAKIDEFEPHQNDVYEVEEIVSHKRVRGGNLRFKIHWKGYSSSDDTWQKREDLSCQNILNEYMKKNNLF